MAVVVSVDAGTTGVRAVAIDETGRQQALSYREFTQHFPRPGWVEHDAEEIRDAVDATLADVGAELAADGQAVAALGITDQRETVVAWDRATGRPRHRAIVWQDRRTAARCDELAAAGALDEVRATTGLVLDPYFTATKAEWLLTEGGVSPSGLALGTIDSWLIWCLSGGTAHVTDVTNASRTMLFDIGSGQWSEPLLELFGVPADALPAVGPSSGRLATTGDDCPLGAGIPISGVAGDQQSALFGQACLSPGMTKNTYGTGSFVLMNVGEQCPSPVEGLLTTVAWQLEGAAPVYALEGAVFVTGAAIGWLRDGLGIIDDPAEVGPLAASVADAGGVYVVPAFTGLGSPWWDPYARGTIVGLTRGTGRAEIARAVVESMALQTRDVVDAMTRAAGQAVTELRVDGGAAVMDVLLQIQADQLDVVVSRPTVTETTALGAAMLAGLAEGVWSSPADVAAAWTLDRTFTPTQDRTAADELHAGWLRAVERSRGWASEAAVDD